MSENTDMTINRLPSLTWNWLKMNQTKVTVQVPLQESAYTENVPKEITASLTELKTKIKTGMGSAMDELLQKAALPVHSYRLAANTVCNEPIRLDFTHKKTVSDATAFYLEAEENSRMTVIMHFDSPTDAAGMAAIQTRIRTKKNASVTLIQIQTLGENLDFYNDIGTDCEDQGSFHLIQLVLSGNHTYLGSYTNLFGKRSELTTDIGYIVQKEQRLDMNYDAYHTGEKTNCDINASGVLRDQGSKIFRGTIDFRKGCAGAVGNEMEDVLLMDDTVINQTIPLILCDEEDVEGNHGASIGKLDEGLLFYLQSRGMELDAIYEMMARARIEAVAGKIQDETARKTVEEFLNR